MFNESQIQEIINLYQLGKTQKEISIIYKCSQKTISNILIENKISCRKRKDVFNNIKYNDTNLDFFKKIDSEKSAYYLGFLYADGCVQIKNNAYMVSLKLKSNDQIIIEKFRNIMSPSSPIKISKNKDSENTYSYFRINKKEICEQLIHHGCVPNKSLILEFPTAIPNELIRHFLRGYSDGDGCIYANKLQKTKTSKSYTNYIWKIVSTKMFTKKIELILKEQLDINCSQSLSRPKTNQITTVLSIGGNYQTMKLLDWLYKDATIYLPRKYDKYLEFKNYEKENGADFSAP